MTKKEQILNELGDIAKLLNIKLDYITDLENHREYLVCDDVKICTCHTSIHGIREEFFGYVILQEWKHRSFGAFDNQTRRHIKQYWYDDKFNQPFYRSN